MPCFCHYDPPEEAKKYVKDLCRKLVDTVKRLESDGDPLDCTLKDIHTLLDHMYTGKCEEIFDKDD